MRLPARICVCGAIAAVTMLGAIGARAQGVRIENLGSGATLTGTELIPMWQNADPAVTTTPVAIANYVNGVLKPTINSGRTVISGLPTSGMPTGDGLWLYGDTGGLLQASSFFFADTANGNLVINYTSTELGSLPIVQAQWHGAYLYGTNPGLNLLAIGTTGNGFSGITFAAAYNSDPGSNTGIGQSWTLNPLVNQQALGQLLWQGYNGTTFAIGALMQIVTTQAWTGSANGVQWQWCAVSNNATYGGGCYVMTLDGTNGLVLTGVPIKASYEQLAGVTFANLPSAFRGQIVYVTDGNAADCGDSTCSTFGTTVTGGGGSLRLLVWYNGSAWHLIGS